MERRMSTQREGWTESVRWGRDGWKDGRRNATDGSCLARAGRERRGWHHRVREHTQKHTVYTPKTHALTLIHMNVGHLTPLVHVFCCQECFQCLFLCQENVSFLINRQINGAADASQHIVCINLFSAPAISSSYRQAEILPA